MRRLHGVGETASRGEESGDCGTFSRRPGPVLRAVNGRAGRTRSTLGCIFPFGGNFAALQETRGNFCLLEPAKAGLVTSQPIPRYVRNYSVCVRVVGGPSAA